MKEKQTLKAFSEQRLEDCREFVKTIQENEQKEIQLKYWKEALQDLPEPLVLPGDAARSLKFDYKGKGGDVGEATDADLMVELTARILNM